MVMVFVVMMAVMMPAMAAMVVARFVLPRRPGSNAGPAGQRRARGDRCRAKEPAARSGLPLRRRSLDFAHR
jgi:hypothetical protein